MQNIGPDILENDIIDKYPGVLEILLRDHSSQNNIVWATEDYVHLGSKYKFHCQIYPELISGENGNIIMPRVYKTRSVQQSRSRDMAEVFTPSWICNAQNNLIDNSWFGRKDVFNSEFQEDGINTWKVTSEKIEFPSGKDWKQYVRSNRLEVACGEAPYIASRYDTTNGDFIDVVNRIGILDRKLRVINENVESSGDWLQYAQEAYKSTYAFEWQGDNLLLAREAMLVTFIENYLLKFQKEPLLKSIKYIAYIISWNVWQMDGVKGVLPETCQNKLQKSTNLFGEVEITGANCLGCEKGLISKHNGIYAIIKDWKNKDLSTSKKGRKLKYIDLLKKN